MILATLVFAVAADLPPALRDFIAKKQALGAVMAIDVGGRQEIHAAGEASKGKPMAADAVFEIGSVTKVFTNLLLCEMAARGEVALDDPVAKLLPPNAAPPERDGKKITLALLASHHSGLPRLPVVTLVELFSPDPYAKYGGAAMLAGLPKAKLQRAPGAGYEYSNYGAGLLGFALARKLGKPYEEALRDRVLAPLGMKETAIALPAELKARFVQGHTAEGGLQGPWAFDAMAGAGALRSTAADMLRFLRWQYEDLDPALPKSLRKALADARAPRRPISAKQAVALGWHVNLGTADGAPEVVWHNGGTGGYCSMACCVPATKTAVVILANGPPNGQADAAAFKTLLALPPNAARKPAAPAGK